MVLRSINEANSRYLGILSIIIDPEFWVMQKMRKSKLPHLIVNFLF
jgi:hypothetical protein